MIYFTGPKSNFNLFSGDLETLKNCEKDIHNSCTTMDPADEQVRAESFDNAQQYRSLSICVKKFTNKTLVMGYKSEIQGTQEYCRMQIVPKASERMWSSIQ